jgi:hypothetical protein
VVVKRVGAVLGGGVEWKRVGAVFGEEWCWR